jgi:hypothetical protein
VLSKKKCHINSTRGMAFVLGGETLTSQI